jgi:hypothetical protein
MRTLHSGNAYAWSIQLAEFGNCFGKPVMTESSRNPGCSMKRLVRYMRFFVPHLPEYLVSKWNKDTALLVISLTGLIIVPAQRHPYEENKR